MKASSFFVVILSALLLVGCCAQCVDCDERADSKEDQVRGDDKICGRVFAIENNDTSLLADAQIVIYYAYGWSTDCLHQYSERDTLTSDSVGNFCQDANAYVDCYYGYKISKEGYSTRKKAYAEGGGSDSGNMCAEELKNFKIYLEKN